VHEIKGIARVRFHPGKVAEWKRLTEEALEIVRTKDTGALQYEHFANISLLMEPLMHTAFVTGEVPGTPNAKMKAMLGEGEPKQFTPWKAGTH